jgi:hypothetical protein
VEEEKLTKAGDLDKKENIETMHSDCQDKDSKLDSHLPLTPLSERCTLL